MFYFRTLLCVDVLTQEHQISRAHRHFQTASCERITSWMQISILPFIQKLLPQTVSSLSVEADDKRVLNFIRMNMLTWPAVVSECFSFFITIKNVYFCRKNDWIRKFGHIFMLNLLTFPFNILQVSSKISVSFLIWGIKIDISRYFVWVYFYRFKMRTRCYFVY